VPGATLTEDDVTAYCRRELAAYKVPKEALSRHPVKTERGQDLAQGLACDPINEHRERDRQPTPADKMKSIVGTERLRAGYYGALPFALEC